MIKFLKSLFQSEKEKEAQRKVMANELYIEELKEELYHEYQQLDKANRSLTANERNALVGLTLQPDWDIYHKMLENWKYRVVVKGFTIGKTNEDMITIKTQVKNISVLKTFQNKYKANYKAPEKLTEDDPATTVELP